MSWICKALVEVRLTPPTTRELLRSEKSEVRRERLTGLTRQQLKRLALPAGLIAGFVAVWWDLDENQFPLLALVTGAIVFLITVGLVKLAESLWGRYDDIP